MPKSLKHSTLLGFIMTAMVAAWLNYSQSQLTQALAVLSNAEANAYDLKLEIDKIGKFEKIERRPQDAANKLAPGDNTKLEQLKVEFTAVTTHSIPAYQQNLKECASAQPNATIVWSTAALLVGVILAANLVACYKSKEMKEHRAALLATGALAVFFVANCWLYFAAETEVLTQLE